MEVTGRMVIRVWVDMTRVRKSNEEVVGVRRVSEVDARGSVNTKVCSNERERE
jgi:hypothetical protein